MNDKIKITIALTILGMILSGYTWASNTFATKEMLCAQERRLDRFEGKIDLLLNHFSIKGIEGRKS